MRAIAVIRVSTKKQAGDDRYSIPAQQSAIKDYCQREAIELVAEYIEPGTSAYVSDIAKIPGLKTALERIEAGEADALIVHESSRLARTERLMNEVADRLEAAGATFINVSMNGFDYTGSTGRMVLSNEATMNSYWSRKTSEQSRKGKRQQFEQGLPIGQIPFGYTHARVTNPDGTTSTTRKLPPVVVPHEAAAIVKAFEDCSVGATYHQIAREWTAAKHVVHSTKGLDYFQPQTVRDILSNRFYGGYVCHRGEYRKGLHHPIVSEELYWAAQRKVAPVARRVHPPKLLRGIVTCVEGHRLRVLPAKNSRSRPDYIHYYYREPSPDHERSCGQGGLLWSTKQPDAQVEALFRSICDDDTWLEHIDLHAGRSPHRDVATERARIEGKLERLQNEYLNGRLGQDKWDRVFAECQAELASLRITDEPVTSAHNKLTSWLHLWDAASPYAKNETCRLVFETAVIDFKKKELTLVPWPEFAALFDCRVRYLGQDSPGPILSDVKRERRGYTLAELGIAV